MENQYESGRQRECEKVKQVLSALLNAEIARPDSTVAQGIQESKDNHRLEWRRYVDGAILQGGSHESYPNKNLDAPLRDAINATIEGCTSSSSMFGSRTSVPLADPALRGRVD